MKDCEKYQIDIQVIHTIIMNRMTFYQDISVMLKVWRQLKGK
jgi:hypothetical protein